MAAPKGNLYALGNKGGRPPQYNEYFTFILGEFKKDDQGNILLIVDAFCTVENKCSYFGTYLKIKKP